MTAQEMWHQYCQARGLDPAAPYKTRSFGSGDFADGLARLILCGKKRATTAARIAFESSGTPLPQPGGTYRHPLWGRQCRRDHSKHPGPPAPL